jgi:serine/threonine protein kinase
MRTTTSTPPPPREHSELSVGSMVAGYVVEALIGVGSMAHVYRARSPRTGQRVAVKLLSRTVGARPDQVERLRREAEVLQLIDHPHVVRVHDFGATADGCPFLVMELVVGRTLSALIEAEAPVGARRLRVLLSQIAAGLAATHEAGVVHRDLKPSNVLVQELGPSVHVKLVDFGLVRGLEVPLGRALTHHQAVLGTPLYMAPEQIMSARHVGAAADLYALGVLGYELLSGRVPFEGPMMAVFERHLHEPPPPLVTTTGLEPLVLALLEKDPARRPPSAQAVIATLAQLGHEREPPTDRTLLLDPTGPALSEALEPRSPSGITELVAADVAATSDLTAMAPLPRVPDSLPLVFDEGTVEDAPWSQRLGRVRHAPPATRILVEGEGHEGPLVLASHDGGLGRPAPAALDPAWREHTSWFDQGPAAPYAERGLAASGGQADDDEDEPEELPIFEAGVDVLREYAGQPGSRGPGARADEDMVEAGEVATDLPSRSVSRGDARGLGEAERWAGEVGFGDEATGLDEAVGFGDEATGIDTAFDDDATALAGAPTPAGRAPAFDDEVTDHEGAERRPSRAPRPEVVVSVPLPEVLRAQPVFDAAVLEALRGQPASSPGAGHGEARAAGAWPEAAGSRGPRRDGRTRVERGPRELLAPTPAVARIEVSHGASWGLRALTTVAVLLAAAAVIVALAARAEALPRPLPSSSSSSSSPR